MKCQLQTLLIAVKHQYKFSPFTVSLMTMMAPTTCSRFLVCIVLMITTRTPGFSQSSPFTGLVYSNDSLNNLYPREKIFVHQDRPYYRVRDTVWLKGYILDGPENIPNDSSRLAYAEIINSQNEVVKRIAMPCYMGLFAGNIALTERSFPQGEYRLRAYTRYMMNFGDSLLPETRFSIIDPGPEAWETRIKELRFADNRLLLSAALSGLNGKLSNRTVTVRLRAKNKIIFRARAITDPTGNIYIDTLINNADKQNLQLEIADSDDIKLQVPVRNEKGLVDLQFLPEGGTFIAGKQQRLGFKAVNTFGKGADVKGVIKNSKGIVVASFASIHKGMGIVSLTPSANETYTAFLENGPSFQLPVTQSSGTTMHVINHAGDDSIQLKIDGSADYQNKAVYFVASSRGITAARGRVMVSPNGYKLAISKKQLLQGVTVFTLYNEALQPINGRAVFIRHNDDLKLTLISNKTEYLKKDSVSLTLNVQDAPGNNIMGSFSMAVLDTGQVKISPDAENLLSYMLLSSDLRGEVEEPYYYFKQPVSDALEALMLTQGWVSYTPHPGVPSFAYEREFVINGRVSNVFNKSLSSVKVSLFGKAGKNNAFFFDTVTNAKGDFSFTHFPLYETDSISVLIRALNKREKAFNIGVDLTEPHYPSVSTRAGTYGSGSILTDTVARDYLDRQEKIRTALIKDGTMLQEVVVKSKRKIQGSKNLNDDGGADQTIDEETLNKKPKETLLNVLQKQVKGFRVGSPPKSSRLLYMINSNIVRLVIDGVDVHFFYQPVMGTPDDYKMYIENYLTYITAEDVKGIEIMNSSPFNSRYRGRFLTLAEQMNSGPATIDFSFIEVTTHSGQGPFQKKTPGMYLLKPVYPALPKKFYSPRYSSPEEKTIIPDLRNTVYWNPDVVTDKDGNAQVSFYTSESSSSYVVIIQGTDLKGKFGVLYQPLIVKPRAGR
jgi:hypothetical protein